MVMAGAPNTILQCPCLKPESGGRCDRPCCLNALEIRIVSAFPTPVLALNQSSVSLRYTLAVSTNARRMVNARTGGRKSTHDTYFKGIPSNMGDASPSWLWPWGMDTEGMVFGAPAMTMVFCWRTGRKEAGGHACVRGRWWRSGDCGDVGSETLTDVGPSVSVCTVCKDIQGKIEPREAECAAGGLERFPEYIIIWERGVKEESWLFAPMSLISPRRQFA